MNNYKNLTIKNDNFINSNANVTKVKKQKKTRNSSGPLRRSERLSKPPNFFSRNEKYYGGGFWLWDMLRGNKQLQNNNMNITNANNRQLIFAVWNAIANNSVAKKESKPKEVYMVTLMVDILQECKFANNDNFKHLLRELVFFLGLPDNNKKGCNDENEQVDKMMDIIEYFNTTKIHSKTLRTIWSKYFTTQ